MSAARFVVPVGSGVPGGTTAAYIVDGQRPLLVDPAGRTDALDDAIADQPPAHIAVTHHHPDHVGAVAAYARETDATLWAREGREAEFETATGVTPDRTFQGGTQLPVGDPRVTVVALPGHTVAHVGFLVDDHLLCGDLAVAEGSVAVAAPEGDLRAYLTSLRRVHAMAPAWMLPGHGPEIAEPRATCRRLIAHRLDREAKIRAAVADGAETLAAIRDRAYAKDLTGVRDLAQRTVVAHLEKLAVEGAVDWDGDRATPA